MHALLKPITMKPIDFEESFLIILIIIFSEFANKLKIN
jgi:hypothetical protein